MVLTCCRELWKLGPVFRKMPLYQTHTHAIQNSSLSFSVKWVEFAPFLPDFPDLQGVAPHRFRRAGRGPSSVPGNPDIMRAELWDGTGCARSCLASPFSSGPWLCLSAARSGTWRTTHQEEESPSLSPQWPTVWTTEGLSCWKVWSVASPILVCSPPPLGGRVLCSVSSSHPYLLLSSLLQHLGTAPPQPPQGFDLPSPPPAQSSLYHLSGNIPAHPPWASAACPCRKGQGMAPPGSDIWAVI